MPFHRIGLLLFLASFAPHCAQADGFTLPPGFAIHEFADDALAHDVYTMTIDARGRVFVAGRGYIRQLIDAGDGHASRALDVADSPKDGAQGLLVEGDTLWAVGDGALRRFQLGADGRAIGPSTDLVRLKTGQEHTAHAIRRGPDGWLYLIGGDATGGFHSDTKKQPVGGYMARLSPDFHSTELVADGFRNPYDFDFTADGEPITFDSDNERCIGLPWYEGCRLNHIIPGGHYGWQAPQHATTWRMPPYFIDVVAPVLDLGRGSPTGVAVYRHRQFPEHYRGGVFLADWTFGRIWFVALTPHDGSYTGQAEQFLQSTGELGFAPTALAVHPLTGELYVAIGGRGTRGGVYRISYPAGARTGFVTPALNGDERVRNIQARNASLRNQRPRSDELGRLRECQRALGDIGSKEARGTVFEGYTPRDGALLRLHLAAQRACIDALSPKNAPQNREISRLWAMMADDRPETLTAVITQVATAPPIDQVHYLIVLARLRGARSAAVTQVTAIALLNLDRRYTENKIPRDRNWPLRIAEVHAELSRKDPNLNRAIVEAPEFDRPGNAVLTRAPGFDRRRAAERFLERAQRESDLVWNADMIALLDTAPADVRRPWLDQLWKRGGFESALLPVMAGDPRECDRAKFADGLRLPERSAAECCLQALEWLPPSSSPADVLPIVRAMRPLGSSKADIQFRARLAALLRRATHQSIGDDAAAWSAWFVGAHPGYAVSIGGTDGIDRAAWMKRRAAIAWANGNARRGEVVFEKASCASCHSGGSAIGPDLHGVGRRFSLDDLLTAILEPSKDIAPQYRSVQIATAGGKVYQGLIVYDSPDGTMLQIGPTTTVRIAGPTIESRSAVEVSLMPAGLLDKLSDRDVADLVAYLRTLR